MKKPRAPAIHLHNGLPAPRNGTETSIKPTLRLINDDTELHGARGDWTVKESVAICLLMDSRARAEYPQRGQFMAEMMKTGFISTKDEAEEVLRKLGARGAIVEQSGYDARHHRVEWVFPAEHIAANFGKMGKRQLGARDLETARNDWLRKAPDEAAALKEIEGLIKEVEALPVYSRASKPGTVKITTLLRAYMDSESLKDLVDRIGISKSVTYARLRSLDILGVDSNRSKRLSNTRKALRSILAKWEQPAGRTDAEGEQEELAV